MDTHHKSGLTGTLVMSNLIIGIDVDNTTLDSSPAWWNWLWHVCDGESDNLPEKLE